MYINLKHINRFIPHIHIFLNTMLPFFENTLNTSKAALVIILGLPFMSKCGLQYIMLLSILIIISSLLLEYNRQHFCNTVLVPIIFLHVT